MFKSVRKRDGKVASFNQEKITEAIAKAGAATGDLAMIVQKISPTRLFASLKKRLRLASQPSSRFKIS